MIRHEPRYVSRYFIKMMLSYCLVIIIGLGLVSAFTTSWVVRTLTEKENVAAITKKLRERIVELRELLNEQRK